uniref:Ycf1 n=1 Tax=Romanomermis culicivorax TaxID=13658 RepID=A0A915IIE8_ROMCU
TYFFLRTNLDRKNDWRFGQRTFILRIQLFFVPSLFFIERFRNLFGVDDINMIIFRILIKRNRTIMREQGKDPGRHFVDPRANSVDFNDEEKLIKSKFQNKSF